MSSRITSRLMSDQSVRYLNNNLTLLSRLQTKLSTNQNINIASDDPVGLTRLLDLSNALRADTRYARNIDDATSEVNTSDNAMAGMVNLIQRAQELTTQAANFTNNQDGRNAIALEIDQIINQLVQLGNTDISGKYIFAGMRSDQPPFTRVGDNIAYNGTPPAQNWQRDVEISRGTTLTVNVNGDDVLGQANLTATGPPPVFAAGSHGLFQTLLNLRADLQNPTDPAQLSNIGARLDELTSDMNNLLARQAVIGSVANRLDLTGGRIADRKSILTQQYASIQDINMPAVIADMNQQQSVFQASLGVTARLMQTSLIDFLR